MPKLDFANPIHTFSAGNLTYTAIGDCYLYGETGYTGSGTITVTIDSTPVAYSNCIGGALPFNSAAFIDGTPIAEGQVITVSGACPELHIFNALS